MIEELHIEGFRSLKDVTWRPGRLNVLIGPNGGGKSNLLRAVELLTSSADGRLQEWIISHGGLTPLLWDDSASRIMLGVHIHPSASASLNYSFSIHPFVSGTHFLGEELVAAAHSPDRPLLQKTEAQLTIGKRSIDVKDYFLEGETALSQVSIGQLSSDDLALWLLKWNISQMMIYHDLRIDSTAPIRQAAVTRHAKQVSSDGQNLVAVLHTLYESNPEFERTIDDAMSAAFPTDYEKLKFPAVEDGRVQLRLRRRQGKRLHSAADLSDGTLRFLLLATILATPDPPPLIAIDEPEVGLHPRMLPIIAELAVEASRKTQVVLTTHAPEMLDAFGETLPDTTICTWEGDHTELKIIEGDDLKKWVQDYSLGRFMFSGEAGAVL
jgi:predicted ATPase